MESSIRPDFVQQEVIKGKMTYYINLGIELVDDMFQYDSIEVDFNKWEYGGIVDALITYKYPNEKMQAVINNYLLEPENEEFVTAFNEMQAWRKEAKEIAKQALDYELH